MTIRLRKPNEWMTATLSLTRLLTLFFGSRRGYKETNGKGESKKNNDSSSSNFVKERRKLQAHDSGEKKEELETFTSLEGRELRERG